MKKTILTILTVSALTTGTRAAIVLNEDFNGYTNGPIVGNSGNTLWASHSGTLKQMQVLNQQLSVLGSQSEDVNATFTLNPPYDTTNNPTVSALYASFTAKFTSTPNGAGNYFAHFKDDGTVNFRARIFALTNGAAAGKFRLGIASTNSASTTAGFTNYPVDLDLNTTYTVVTRLDLTNGISTLWIDPTNETDLSVTATTSISNVLAVSSYAFRESGGEGNKLIDDLAVGTLFKDVAGTNRPPSITAIPNQNIAANSATAAIPFTIQDKETPATSLVLSSNSSNTLLVPDENIVIGGSDSNRTVTVTPAAGQQGVTTITLSVSDGDNVTTTSFQLTVGAPTISAIPNQSTPTNTPTAAIPFTISDAESPASSLTLSASSSNPTLITNIVFGGSDSNRTVTLTPEPDQAGISTITITVSDGTNTANTSFVITVFPILGIVLADNFDSYSDGSLYLAAGSPWQHHSPTATNFGDIQVIGGRIQLSQSLFEDLNAALTYSPFAPNSGVILYSGFNINLSALPSPSALGNYFAHFKDSGNGFRARVFVSTTNAAAGKFRVGIANQGGNFSAQVPTDLSTNTTYGVVTRYNVGTGESRIWLNPAVESDPSYDATDSKSTATITSYAFREDLNIGTNNIDNLKVSTAFADVVPPIPTVTQPNITSIQIVGGNVQIDFTAGAGDTTGLFTLQSAGTVNGTYGDVGAVISQLGPGSFEAVIAPSGDTQFYRIKR
ncbi:MAG: hypothetical protein HY298_05870 [Verrucomicrobia bacterium]|nr:hypothetical protein [Verrucomicrobiota bacterium]